ncbi:zinc-binding alcohol dehydrogenase family protein [Pseudomonas sp. NFPP10]|uniref:zinc-binding alcohol dehydrogenase family protein n=1 Tax=Pseudomonas TaxID=286 RepID=UPI000891FAAB|nr:MULTISPECIES: zinc-binding alcohol dehydrogenase family protein [Pseudomonas]POA91495.1 zinc-binding alcohol dehydrogenase family protein [Pseudomonas protegens]SDA23763.1 zinc-binding alcohol dehydrogenase family protein [Pseudomonas sp. NFPP12]SEL59353.1 zinc-binding alcohol dehydrogenase family protein [Pseudomonas sp. NFPP10]SFJ28986.1 zinc-binding alcohol dehydrogenase family protein [Pseudomonas sp. NFPP08]SFM79592.1 zinc-binding alcohol dehydrogenase family protein [Pseudomonas sp. N
MKAIAYLKGSHLSDPHAFCEVQLDPPPLEPHDLLVAVEAVSVNPLDTKVRAGQVAVPDEVRTLGWDASGVVRAVGSAVTLFAPGDAVFYAGTFTRDGANAELHRVDERLVGHKPASLSFAQAAAMPLTSLTAWQLLFERLGRVPGDLAEQGTLLIVGGAGGVGSVLIQLARRLTAMTVIATASRPDSRQWCLDLGAHQVLDHSRSLVEQLVALDLPPVTHIAALTHTQRHYAELARIIVPHGHIALIDDHDFFDAVPLKAKSVSLHWEMVFTRALFKTPDMIEQHHILNRLAQLLDQGLIRCTLNEVFSPFNADSLRRAHERVEQGGLPGKVVVARDAQAIASL